MTVDIIETSEPAVAQAGSPAELSTEEFSPRDIAIDPLDLIENPKVRTKLQLYAILSGLYVTKPAPMPRRLADQPG
jgi:hypothetical protein